MIQIRLKTVLGLFVGAVGLLLTFILGLWTYVKVTTTPLHPDPQNVPSAVQGPPSAQWAAAVEQGRQIGRSNLLEQNLPGLSVAVGVGGEVVWAEGFGWSDIEDQVRVTPHTRFRIGSASTMLTAAAVGLLLEKDRLKLDEKIQTYVPAFPEKQWPVTLRQLMAHTAGVRDDAGDEENVWTACERTADGLKRFANEPLLFQPGTLYRYSSYGWILVSAAVERGANEPFVTFMRKQIFEPLGMDDTRIDAASEATPDRASSYFPRFAADPRYGPQEPDALDYSCFAGASAILSTPSDLVRFGMAINSGKLLQPATVQLLQTSQRLPSGEETGYGLGWDLETVTLAGEQRRIVAVDGTLRDGMVSSFVSFPERALVVAVTSNTSFADTASVALKIAEVFAGQTKSPARK
jgi:CubicO group peptidase (beta-lactamase class C family)